MTNVTSVQMRLREEERDELLPCVTIGILCKNYMKAIRRGQEGFHGTPPIGSCLKTLETDEETVSKNYVSQTHYHQRSPTFLNRFFWLPQSQTGRAGF